MTPTHDLYNINNLDSEGGPGEDLVRRESAAALARLATTGIPTPPPDEVAKSQTAYLNQSATTTPSFPNELPTGAVPSLRPNPGMLRALLQPILFFTLTEPVDAYEAGDTVALQFWGEGRVMLTPLPREAAKGRIPTTFPANKLHGYIAVPRH